MQQKAPCDSKGGQTNFLQPKSLHPMIVCVQDEHPALRIAGDAPGLVEFAVTPSAVAKRGNEAAFRCEFLDAMVVRIGDVDITRRVHSNVGRKVELPVARPEASPLGDEASGRRESHPWPRCDLKPG